MARITTTSVIKNVNASLAGDEVQAVFAILNILRGNTMFAGGQLGHLRNLLAAAGATGEGFQVKIIDGEVWVDRA